MHFGHPSPYQRNESSACAIENLKEYLLLSVLAYQSYSSSAFYKNLSGYSCFTMLLVSAVQRSESAICIHISPSLLDLPLTLPSHHIPKANTKWITDLNTGVKILSLLDKNKNQFLFDLELIEDLLEKKHKPKNKDT